MKINYHKKCLKRVVQLAMVYSVLFFCTSCVNTISETDSGEESQTSNLTFRVSPYSLSPMTRATTATLALKTICAALYMQDSSSNCFFTTFGSGDCRLPMIGAYFIMDIGSACTFAII